MAQPDQAGALQERDDERPDILFKVGYNARIKDVVPTLVSLAANEKTKCFCSRGDLG